MWKSGAPPSPRLPPPRRWCCPTPLPAWSRRRSLLIPLRRARATAGPPPNPHRYPCGRLRSGGPRSRRWRGRSRPFVVAGHVLARRARLGHVAVEGRGIDQKGAGHTGGEGALDQSWRIRTDTVARAYQGLRAGPAPQVGAGSRSREDRAGIGQRNRTRLIHRARGRTHDSQGLASQPCKLMK